MVLTESLFNALFKGRQDCFSVEAAKLLLLNSFSSLAKAAYLLNQNVSALISLTIYVFKIIFKSHQITVVLSRGLESQP